VVGVAVPPALVAVAVGLGVDVGVDVGSTTWAVDVEVGVAVAPPVTVIVPLTPDGMRSMVLSTSEVPEGLSTWTVYVLPARAPPGIGTFRFPITVVPVSSGLKLENQPTNLELRPLATFWFGDATKLSKVTCVAIAGGEPVPGTTVRLNCMVAPVSSLGNVRVIGTNAVPPAPALTLPALSVPCAKDALCAIHTTAPIIAAHITYRIPA
jgi:hypothetical protein